MIQQYYMWNLPRWQYLAFPTPKAARQLLETSWRFRDNKIERETERELIPMVFFM